MSSGRATSPRVRQKLAMRDESSCLILRMSMPVAVVTGRERPTSNRTSIDASASIELGQQSATLSQGRSENLKAAV